MGPNPFRTSPRTPVARSPRRRLRQYGPELFDAPFVREEPAPVYGEDHAHITAGEAGRHELFSAPDARGCTGTVKVPRSPSTSRDSFIKPPGLRVGVRGGEDAMGKVGKGGVARAR